MTKLSKLLVMAVVIVAVVATMSISVSAYTNNDLINYVNGIHEINTMTFELSNDQKNAIISYLTANPVSDDVANSIKADMDSIEAKIRATGASSIDKINANVKAEVVALAQSATSKAGLNLAVNSNAKTFTITTKEGKVLVSTSYAGKVNTPVAPASNGGSAATATTSGSTLLYTGSNYAVYALPVLAIVAVAIVAKKRA